MSRRVFVSLLPSLVDASRLAGASAVIIDVLRASTTVCAALQAGAARVIPFATIDDAKRFADKLAAAGEPPLLGGERGGVKIEGFDLGNSPREYTAERVGGRTIAFTTTNGTRALMAAASAARVYMGAYANLNQLSDRLAEQVGDIHLICAGTDGQVTLEDTVCAGEIATALMQRLPRLELGNDEAIVALAVQQTACDDRTRLEALRSGLGGRNLVSVGYDADIEHSARIGSAPVVPVYQDGALVIEHDEKPAAEEGEWAI